MALDRFIDDISVIAVEDCLISRLPTLLTPSRVLDLAADDVTRLVGESDETAYTRRKLTEKLTTLQAGLKDIKRYERHGDRPHVASQGTTKLSMTGVQSPRKAEKTAETPKVSDSEEEALEETPSHSQGVQEEGPLYSQIRSRHASFQQKGADDWQMSPWKS